jgi:hypothetical protein
VEEAREKSAVALMSTGGKLTEDDRTSEVGLYHFARSYRAAADCLDPGPDKQSSTHPDAPRDFLYIHSIELYLKAFLRLNGLGVKSLKSLGHDIPALGKETAERGLVFDTDTGRVITLLNGDNVFGARYIKTGAYHRPTTAGLKQAAEYLHRHVRVALRDRGRLCAD